MFVPAVRNLIWKAIAKRFVVVRSRGGFTASSRSDSRNRDSKVVDLDEEDYHRNPDGNSPCPASISASERMQRETGTTRSGL
jgi:UPF0716 protein FxsA